MKVTCEGTIVNTIELHLSIPEHVRTIKEVMEVIETQINEYLGVNCLRVVITENEGKKSIIIEQG